MNLLERDTKHKKESDLEEFNQEELKDFEQEELGEEPQRDKMVKNISWIAVLLGGFFLLILFFALWFMGQMKKQDEVDPTSEVTPVESMEAGAVDDLGNLEEMEEPLAEEDVNPLEEDVLVGGHQPIVVEEWTAPTQTDALLESSKEDPLDQDMYYEDESYEKEYIMKEMYDWWDEKSVSALYDLSALRRYRKLSYRLKGTNQFYYYGATDAQGQPHGKGAAMYGDDTYYFGDFVHGKREGNGYWLRFYYDQKHPFAKDGKYIMHSYSGGFVNDLPEGEGQEHFDVNLAKLENDELIFQNIIGTFKAGRYHGEMFANTVEKNGNISEWDGEAVEGKMELQYDVPPSSELPVWKNRFNPDRYLRIAKKENKNCGVTELIEAVEGK